MKNEGILAGGRTWVTKYSEDGPWKVCEERPSSYVMWLRWAVSVRGGWVGWRKESMVVSVLESAKKGGYRRVLKGFSPRSVLYSLNGYFRR